MTSTEQRVRHPAAAGLGFALLGVVIFSFSLPMTKLALQGFTPITIAIGRAAIAGVIAAVVLRLAGIPWPGRQYLRPLLITSLGVVAGWPVLTTIALQSITSAHAAVIAAGLPIATAVFAVLRAGEHPPRAFWWASLAGTAAVMVFALTRGGADGGALVADLLMVGGVLLAALGYAEGAVIARDMPGWQVVSWTLVVCLPATVPIAAVSYALTRGETTPTPVSVVGLLWLAVFSMYLGFFAWYRGLGELGVARGGQVQLLQPLLTLLWSVLLLGEVVGADTLLAAAAVIAAVVWTQRARSPHESAVAD